MRAVILAAGAGRRVFPYELTRQKAAMPVCNEGLVAWTLRWLEAAGVSEIVAVVGHLEQRVRHSLLGHDVRFVRQGARQGTVPAVLDALAEIGDAEPFLVVYGDCLFDQEGISGFVTAMAQERPVAGAMLAPLGDRNSLDWVCGGLAGDSLRGISGHPRGASHRMCGLYYFDPRAVPFIRANPGVVDSVNVGGMPRMEPELAQSVQMIVDAGLEVRAVEHRGLFVDIDKPWHVLEANCRLADYLAGGLDADEVGEGSEISDGAEISGNVLLGKGCRIGNRVVVSGSLIVADGAQITNGAILGGNCVVGRGAKIRDYGLVGGSSVVGPGALVGHGAELGGVLFEGAYLYHYCEMSGVFGARHDTGAATVCGTLRFDDGDAPHTVQGRRELPEVGANESYFGDYTRTGVNAIIMPGVKVGAYSCVGPGVIQYEDVPHNSLVLAKQETVTRPWGPEKYGW